MSKPNRPQSGSTNLASCIVATIFLIFIIIIILIIFFTLFKPTDPKISVNAVQLPSFSLTNSTPPTVTFSFTIFLSVKNPNRAVFTHYDSSLQLLYSGNQVGFMFIPSGKIDAGRSTLMTASFTVQSFPLTAGRNAVNALNGAPFGIGAVGPGPGMGLGLGPDSVMEIESRMRMAGRVRVMHFFTHHVEARNGCRVAVAVNDGKVLGYHC